MKTLIAKKIGMTQIYDENSKSLGGYCLGCVRL